MCVFQKNLFASQPPGSLKFRLCPARVRAYTDVAIVRVLSVLKTKIQKQLDVIRGNFGRASGFRIHNRITAHTLKNDGDGVGFAPLCVGRLQGQ